MPGERESNEIKKSMAYDLLMILRSVENPDEKTYSTAEVENLINTYIVTTTSNG